MRVLVCGGRDYDDDARVWSELRGLTVNEDGHPEPGTVVIHGGCPTGADAWASAWAIWNDWAPVYEQVFPADWDKNGRAAGPIRNSQMLAEGKPDVVLAFPGGRGTADMVRKAKAAGVRVIEVK